MNAGRKHVFPAKKLSSDPAFAFLCPAGGAGPFLVGPQSHGGSCCGFRVASRFLLTAQSRAVVSSRAWLWFGMEMRHCSEERWDPRGSSLPGSAGQSPIPDTLQRGREGWGQPRVLQTSKSARTDTVITFGSTLYKYSCSFKDNRHFLGCLQFQGFCLSKAGRKQSASEQPQAASP